MKLELFFKSGDCAPESLRGKNAVVIDVLRATSVIVTAIHNGATAVTPFKNAADAMRYAHGMAGVVTGGERNAERIAGFDCGNSPFEYSPAVVAGKEVVLSTTNGTLAIERASLAGKTFILCMLNVGAAARALLPEKRDAAIICSGTDGKFSADDALCAGAFVDAVCRLAEIKLDDAGRFARDFYAMSKHRDMKDTLRDCFHLRRLQERGYGADVDYCLRLDVMDTTPVYRHGKITLPG